MTAKEKVLQIYPHAHIVHESDIVDRYCITAGTIINGKFEFISRSTTNPERAWRKAWKDIQEDMLEMLEDES
jgi:hypothetical protein